MKKLLKECRAMLYDYENDRKVTWDRCCDLLDRIDQALENPAAAEAMADKNGWISVEDGLPDKYLLVDVKTETITKAERQVDYYQTDGGDQYYENWIDKDGGEIHPTHWRYEKPLPKPPKK